MTYSRKAKSFRSRHLASGDSSRNHVILWVLRTIMQFHGYKKIRRSVEEESVFSGLGVDLEIDGERRPDSTVRADLASLLERYEERVENLVPTCGQVADNVRTITPVLGMNEAEQAILTFMAFLHADNLLNDAMEGMGRISHQESFRLFSVVLGIPLRKVLRALGGDGILLITV
jgi:hypothetical protein